MSFLFSPTVDVDIVLDGQNTRKMVEMKLEDGKKENHYLYFDGETVSGKVNITLRRPGTRIDHQGIKIEFIGQIELFYDRSNRHEFTSLIRELARPGELSQNMSYDFEFVQVEKPFESYTGTNVRLQYFLRVTMVKRLSNVVKELPIIVHTLSRYPETNSSIKMEVGIEDCLHIEFEYNRSKYHLRDVIVGKIYFLLVRIKIKHMEIQIIKKESTGSGPNSLNENDTITKYEIMDGLPVRGESIPIRLFLSGYDLTPTMRDVNKKFSVRYFINLVLVDEEDRRYFKQQEITLFRKAEKQKRVVQNSVVVNKTLGPQDSDVLTKAEPNHTHNASEIKSDDQSHNSSDDMFHSASSESKSNTAAEDQSHNASDDLSHSASDTKLPVE